MLTLKYMGSFEWVAGLITGGAGVFIVLAILIGDEYPHSYYITYNFSRADKSAGFGAMVLNRKRKIRTEVDIESARAYIQKQNEFEQCVVMTFTKIKK